MNNLRKQYIEAGLINRILNVFNYQGSEVIKVRIADEDDRSISTQFVLDNAGNIKKLVYVDDVYGYVKIETGDKIVDAFSNKPVTRVRTHLSIDEVTDIKDGKAICTPVDDYIGIPERILQFLSA